MSQKVKGTNLQAAPRYHVERPLSGCADSLGSALSSPSPTPLPGNCFSNYALVQRSNTYPLALLFLLAPLFLSFLLQPRSPFSLDVLESRTNIAWWSLGLLWSPRLAALPLLSSLFISPILLGARHPLLSPPSSVIPDPLLPLSIVPPSFPIPLHYCRGGHAVLLLSCSLSLVLIRSIRASCSTGTVSLPVLVLLHQPFLLLDHRHDRKSALRMARFIEESSLFRCRDLFLTLPLCFRKLLLPSIGLRFVLLLLLQARI